MRMIVPYNKEIVFNTKIASISSISLEYEANVLDEEITGDFIVSGEYKIHEVSINKETFKYRLPFSITLSDNIIRDSIKYDINNFTYDIKGEDTLTVDIEFLLEGEEVIEKEETNKEEPTKDKQENPLEEKKENTRDNNINEIYDNADLNAILNTLDVPTPEKEDKEEIELKEIEENNKINVTEIEDNNIIMNNVNNVNNTYVIYHIHVLEEGESIDNVAAKYNVSKDLILEYNDSKELNTGDKILIPELQDE